MDPCVQRKSKPTATELSPAAYTRQANENETVLQVDLPGVDKEHVSVEVKGHKLTVTGKRLRFANDSAEKKKDKESSDGDTVMENQTPVVYKRTFTLARSVDVEAVKAESFENGVLTLVLPKKEQAQPRKIAVE
ncbi:Small heat shock protein HSP20 [Gracilaria domingensis]|nr:Small heat shock protein HSP20 [Gracilaria domingensis]